MKIKQVFETKEIDERKKEENEIREGSTEEVEFVILASLSVVGIPGPRAVSGTSNSVLGTDILRLMHFRIRVDVCAWRVPIPVLTCPIEAQVSLGFLHVIEPSVDGLEGLVGLNL